jgi:hypothetical protein
MLLGIAKEKLITLSYVYACAWFSVLQILSVIIAFGPLACMCACVHGGGHD